MCYINIEPDIEELLSEYIKEVSEQLSELEKYIISSKTKFDYLNVKRIAHNIKGSAGSYGISIISDLFQKFENIIKFFEEKKFQKFDDYIIDKLLFYIDYTKIIFEYVEEKNYNLDDLIPKIKSDIYDVDLIGNYSEKHNSISSPKKEKSVYKKNKTDDVVENNSSNESSKKILLIGKFPLLKKILQNKLSSKNFEIELVDSVVKALAVVTVFKPDIIITNHREDIFSGTGLFALLKLSNLTFHFKTILLTSNFRDNINGKEYCDYVLEKKSELYTKLINLIENCDI